MKQIGALTITTSGECDIVITRNFDAPRRLVFDAMTKPELLKRWFHGPEGWKLTGCDVDLRVGGAYRYVWTKQGVPEMGMGGVFREIVVPERLVATEVFDDPWYAGEAVDTTVLTESGGKTLMTLTVTYESRAARDGVLATPMEEGMAYGYDRLAELLPALAKE
jgi:uncharacterized protein YndB with AHSA1/START domain